MATEGWSDIGDGGHAAIDGRTEIEVAPSLSGAATTEIFRVKLH